MHCLLLPGSYLGLDWRGRRSKAFQQSYFVNEKKLSSLINNLFLLLLAPLSLISLMIQYKEWRNTMYMFQETVFHMNKEDTLKITLMSTMMTMA